ncbi:MAG: cytochrome P450 [Planctomycetaceae bacterium]
MELPRSPHDDAIRMVSTTDVLRHQVLDVLNLPEFCGTYSGRGRKSVGRSILITGATGFLGAAITARLLDDPEAWEVYCLVRAENPISGMDRIRKSLNDAGLWKESHANHIHAICGDLSLPGLGLDERILQHLVENVSQVLHVAAHLNFIATYKNLKATNVQSTLFLIREFCGRGIPLTYMSSIGVVTGEGFPDALPEGGNYLNDQVEMIGGYTQTKWVTDQIACQLQSRGWPITVLRPAHVIDHTGTYLDPAPIVEFFMALIRDRIAPEIDFHFYVTPLVDLAEMTASVLSQGATGTLHLTSERINYVTVLQRLESRFGVIQRIPLEAWKQRVKKASLEHRREFIALLPYVYYMTDSRLKLGQVGTTNANATGWIDPPSDTFASYLLSLFPAVATDAIAKDVPRHVESQVASRTLPDTESTVDIYDMRAIRELSERHGNVFKVRYKSREVVIVLDARIVRHVLIDHFLDYQKGRGMMGQFGEILGKGLFTSDGEQWERDRRMMAPRFQIRAMEQFESKFEQHTQRLLAQLESTAGQPISIHRVVSKYALGLATDCFFSVTSVEDFPFEVIDELKSLVKEFRQDLKSIPREIFGKVQACYREFRRYVQGLIAERRKVSSGYDDLFEHLQSDASMTDDELFGQISSILAASYDTTNVSLTFVLLQLARHQDEQQQLRDEIANSRGCEQLQDLMKLRRCTAFVDETLRLYPPVWSIPRFSIQRHQVAGYDLPANVDYLIYTWLIHRSPEYWNAPEIFRPARFLDGTDEPRDKSAYHPFSLGKRTCIGMRFSQYEILHLITRLLKRFKVLPVAEEIDVVPLYPVLSTREPVQLTLEKLPCARNSQTY